MTFLQLWTPQNKEQNNPPGSLFYTLIGDISHQWEKNIIHTLKCPTGRDNMLPSQKLTYAIQGVVGKMCILFPLWDILIVPWRVKFTGSKYLSFWSRKSGLSTEPRPPGFWKRFPKMKQGTFLMSTPRTVRSWRNLANRWKIKTYHICRVLFWLTGESQDWETPKNVTDSYQKTHL